MRRILRWIIFTLGLGLALAIPFAVVSEFFVELAREWGWYQTPSNRTLYFISSFRSFVFQTWFLLMSSFLLGVAVGVSVDRLIRKYTKGKTSNIDHQRLYERIEHTKTMIRIDVFDGERENSPRVRHETSSEVIALYTHLSKMGFSVPRFSYPRPDEFLHTSFRYLSAISAFIREGDIDGAKEHARYTLDSIGS